MLPAGVSMRMLACPVPVIRTWLPLVAVPPVAYFAERGLPDESTCRVAARPASGRPTVVRRWRRATLIRTAHVCRKDLDVADEEPVTSPDQHKPTPVKAAYAAGFATIVVLLLMLIGNHQGHVEDIWLIGIAATIFAIIVTDWAQRRNGLKPKK
jgi:hypothetical protein